MTYQYSDGSHIDDGKTEQNQLIQWHHSLYLAHERFSQASMQILDFVVSIVLERNIELVKYFLGKFVDR